MATITKADLRNRVLLKMKVLAAGEVADASDAADVEDAIDDVTAELQVLGLAYWSEDAIPQAVVVGLRMMVIADIAAAFGAEPENREVGLAMIRRAVAEPFDDAPMRHVYF